MTDLELAKKEFFADHWAAGIAAAKKTDMKDPIIQFFFGYCFEHGYSCEKNYKYAADWYRLSANQGDSDAQRNLGRMYKFGMGVAKNFKEAFKWFLKSAEQGNRGAQNYLGLCYEYGEGVAKDPKTAVAWYRKSAEQGNHAAEYNLADMYARGCGVEKDLAQAFYWYKKSAEGEDSRAQVELGLCYELARGTEEDLAKAVDWYLKAAKNGHPAGQCNLGHMLEYGRGIPKNPEEAFSWYKESADKGHVRAWFKMGRCYEYGIGVPANVNEAKKWYKKAAEEGFEDAKEALNRLNAPHQDAAVVPPPPPPQKPSGDPMKELEKMIGLGPVKAEVKKMVGFIQMQKARAAKGLKTTSVSYHCVFTGNPGTGKTTVARVIARVLNQLGVIKTDKLVETDRSGLVAKYIGQTAVKTNEIIDSALDGVLFIDEAYALAQGGENDFGREAVDTLLKRMEDDRDRLVVIIAGYTDKMQHFLNLNPGLKSRFTRYIDFPDYDAEDLVKIFESIAKSEQYTLGEGVRDAVLLRMQDAVEYKDKNFGNGRYARNFYQETIIRKSARFDPNNVDDEIIVADLPELPVREKEGPGDDGLIKQPEKIEDILAELDKLVGIDPVKAEIRKLASFFKVQKQRKAAGLPVAPASYHCVFSGSPGTGKTTVARFMARVYCSLGVIKTDTLIEADRSKLVAEYIGQTAVKTNAIVDSALDGVLFIDEAYTLSNGGEKDFGHEAVDTLLKRMEDDRDRLVVIIAGYTNEMHKFIDMNPGLQSRFTRYIEFPDYSADELTSIFAGMAKKELYVVNEECLSLVHDEMEKLVANKSKSFGNARVARTFYEQVKERQGMRLGVLANPTKEQMMELLPVDISEDAVACNETNPYDILRMFDEEPESKGIYRYGRLAERSVIKRCAYDVGSSLVNAVINDRGLSGQYAMMLAANANAALHMGLGASVEYICNPLALNAEAVFNMTMRAGGFLKVADISMAKLGAYATGEFKDKWIPFEQMCQRVCVDVAKKEEFLFAKNKLPKEQFDAFNGLLHREAYASFLAGFSIGMHLQQEGAQEVSMNGVSVKIDYTRHLNLALAQNNRPLIADVRIKNVSGRKLENCELKVSCPEKFLLDFNHCLGDIWEDKSLHTGSVPVRFNADELEKVASLKKGYLRIEVWTGERMVFRHDYSIEAVAPDHSHDILQEPDLLAAYVIPHCNVVRQLSSDAANILGQGTGDPSLNGYQVDRERVAHMCRAIYTAIQKKFIKYASSPADFGLPGQKLRLPSEIMRFKLATCIDTTLLFASVAEACGLNPVVVLIHGHAFVGVFLEDCSFKQTAVSDVKILRRLCHDNDMIMIETTAMCHSNIAFNSAVDAGMERLFKLDDEDFEWAIDVVMARRTGVHQLSLNEDPTVDPVAHTGKTTHVQDVDPKKPTSTLTLGTGLTQGVLPGGVPPSKVQQVMNFNGGLIEAHITGIKKPSAVNFDGEKIANASVWKDVFEAIFEKLNALDSSRFDSLPDDAVFGKYFVRLESGKRTGKDYFKLKLGSAGDIRAKELANKLYLWRTDYYFQKLLTHLGVDASRFDVV